MSQIEKEIYGYKKNNNLEDAKETLFPKLSCKNLETCPPPCPSNKQN